MTDFNAAYLATRQDRNRAEMDKALAEVDATIAAQQPKPSAAPAQAPTPAPKKEASPGVMQETKRAVLGGVQDALQITSQGLDAAKQAAGAALKGDFKGAKGVLEDNMEEFGTVYRSAALDSPIGRSTLDSTMDAGSRNPAISAEAFNLDKESPMGILADVFGTLNRLPGRALGASDELFWSINYRGEARAQAYRQARPSSLGTGLQIAGAAVSAYGMANQPQPTPKPKP